MNIPTKQLTRFYDAEIIGKWVNELNIFYLFQSRGGVGDDNGQTFKTAIKYYSKDDLIKKLKDLQIEINTIPENTPKPIKGKSYTTKEYSQFKTRIKRFPDLEQPKSSKVFNQNCYVNVYDHTIELSVSGNGNDQVVKYWHVSKEDFQVCKLIEKEMSQLELVKDIDRTIENDRRYISKTHYNRQLNNTSYSKLIDRATTIFLKKLFGI